MNEIETTGTVISEVDQMPGCTMITFRLDPTGEIHPGMMYQATLTIDDATSRRLRRGDKVRLTVTKIG